MTGPPLHRGSLEDGVEKEVRLVAAEEARAAWGSRDRHRITGKVNDQTEGMKATKQWSCSSAMGSSYTPQNSTHVSQEEAKPERQN